MLVLIWVIVGSIAGLLASRFFHRVNGLALDVGLGIVGAIAGGIAVNSLGFPEPGAFMAASIFGAVAGSAAILTGYRAIFRQA